MMHQLIRRGAALLSAAFLSLSMVPAPAEEAASLPVEAEDPIAVRVGNYSYSVSQVQSSLDSLLTLTASASSGPLTAEERKECAETVVENFIGIGLIESRLAEAGRHDFTDAELEQLRAEASSRYEQLWQQIRSQLQESGSTVSDEDVTRALELQGMTVDTIFENLQVSERQLRAVGMFCPDLVLTGEDIDRYFEEQFVAPERDRYAENIPLYEQEILSRNSESFYRPEGYRSVLQILLPIPLEAEKKLMPWASILKNATSVCAKAYTDLAAAAAEAQDWSELDAPRAEYDRTLELLRTAGEDYNARRKELVLPLVEETVAEITRRFEAGEPFENLIAEYSKDRSDRNKPETGYPVHPLSEGWPQEFLDAVFAMETPGTLSGPVITDLGVHILYYAGDLPGGALALTAEETQALEQSARNYYQLQALTEIMQGWKADADIETHPELLIY